MSFLSSMDISGSALTAQRLRMDVVADNIANVSTTRTAAGGPYRRKITMFEQRPASFSDYYNDSMNTAAGGGVRVAQVAEDQSPFKVVYDPTNPDADANGFVQMPNVEVSQEMVDLISASRSYEANVTALNAIKAMAMKALEIGK